MAAFRRIIQTIPPWAFALVLVILTVNIFFLIGRHRMSLGGGTVKYENGYYIHSHVKPGGPVYNAGIRPGDTIVSINSVPIEEWQYSLNVGDTAIAGILHNNKVVSIPVAVVSLHSFAPGFFWSLFIIAVLTSIGSLILLYKKSHEQSARLFFIFIQLFLITINAVSNSQKDPVTWTALNAIKLSNCFLGPVLVHFHLLFPKPSRILHRFNRLPVLLYIVASLLALLYLKSYHDFIFQEDGIGEYFFLIDRIVFSWMTFTFLLAVAIVVYQFRSIKDTLSRNQLRIVITGSAFGFIAPAAYTLFYDSLGEIYGRYPLIMPVSQGAGTFILICCILVAIFRFRIWDIEVFFRKALLYLSASLVIILSYLILLYLVDLLTIRETQATRFINLAVSVIIFLILRDLLQRLIDRLFHRETYDSATVVSDFEEKLAGIYRHDELKSKIVLGLDEIFHFKSFVLNLKKDKLTYEPAFVLGADYNKLSEEFEINPELENKLHKSKVFSPGELEQKPSILDIAKGELIIPLLKDDQPYGFFLCGQKKSEKTYSMQDIGVLSLIAKRVVALFHTAELYQKDLDRQLLLERERARIAQDMHDDIGAGLTKIAMMSESATSEQGTGNSERMARVAGTARGMINRLNVIVWALNPRYDNLDSLISYARRYFGEYLENFEIGFKMEVPPEIPDIPVTPDFRRNAFYAWQEAIHNAVKHGECSEIIFDVKIEGQLMLVTITDNGKGFDQVRPGSGGNGLLNMKRRAEEMGGVFEILSEPGNGTSVMFRMTLV